MHRFFLLLGIIFFYNNLYAQKNILLPDSVRNSVRIDYDNSIGELYIHKNKRYGIKKIYFQEGFNDSIAIYLNGKLVQSLWVNSEKNKNSYVSLKNIEDGKFYYLDIVLYTANEFIEIPVDNRYCIFNVYYIDNKRNGKYANDWLLNYSNNMPNSSW